MGSGATGHGKEGLISTFAYFLAAVPGILGAGQCFYRNLRFS